MSTFSSVPVVEPPYFTWTYVSCSLRGACFFRRSNCDTKVSVCLVKVAEGLVVAVLVPGFSGNTDTRNYFLAVFVEPKRLAGVLWFGFEVGFAGMDDGIMEDGDSFQELLFVVEVVIKGPVGREVGFEGTCPFFQFIFGDVVVDVFGLFGFLVVLEKRYGPGDRVVI